MKISEKVQYAANIIDSIARHDSAEVTELDAALDRVAKYATDAKATARARPRMPSKIAIATDETEVRAKIAAVQEAMKRTTDQAVLATLRDVERTLGAMLPPVTGTLVVTPGAAKANAGA